MTEEARGPNKRRRRGAAPLPASCYPPSCKFEDNTPDSISEKTNLGGNQPVPHMLLVRAICTLLVVCADIFF